MGRWPGLTRWALLALCPCGCASGDPSPEPAPAPPVAVAAAVPAQTPTPDAAPPVELGQAIDAWQAVIERDRLLDRRGASGTVRGRLVDDPATGLSAAPQWLVDESEGEGVLAIRVALPARLPRGSSIAVRGAWRAQGGRWFWAGAAAVQLDSAEPAPLRYPPGLTVADAAEADAVPEITRASTARDGDTVAFAVLAAPAKAGDGWSIADEPGGEQSGWLVLPGERDIYGGQDLRAPDERWHLEPGRQYRVHTAQVERRRRGGGLPLLRAAEPPLRLQ